MTRLLDRPPHTVTVQNMKRQQGLRGAYEDVPDGDPVVVPCSVQAVREWSSEEEIQVDGLQLLTLSRIFARHWPGNVRSIITFDGFHWETVGEPQHFNMSRRTTHWAITIRRRGRV